MPRKRQMVLLVEDSEARQAELKEHLQKLNAVVLAARTHEEARTRYCEAFGKIDLIVLDDCVENPGFSYDADAFLAFLENPGSEVLPYSGAVLGCSDDPNHRKLMREEELTAVTPKGREAIRAIEVLLLVRTSDTDTFPMPD